MNDGRKGRGLRVDDCWIPVSMGLSVRFYSSRFGL